MLAPAQISSVGWLGLLSEGLALAKCGSFPPAICTYGARVGGQPFMVTHRAPRGGRVIVHLCGGESAASASLSLISITAKR